MSHGPVTTSTAGSIAGALPQLEVSSVRLHRLLSDGRWRAGGATVAEELHVDVVPYKLPHSFEIRVATDDGQFGVELSRSDFPALAFACTIDEPSRRDAAASILLDGALPWLAALGWSAREVALRPRPDGGHWVGRVAVRWGEVRGNLLLPKRSDRLLSAIESRLTDRRLPLREDVADLPVAGRILLGAQDVPAHTLKALRRGDVLVGALAALGRPPSGRVELLFEHACGQAVRVQGRLQGHRITMEHDLGKSAIVSTPSAVGGDDRGVSDCSPVALDGLLLTVHVELDALSMKLSEIAALSAGKVIELDRPVESAVVLLRINGQVWARGELVAVADQLGVRITTTGGAHVLPR